MRKTPLPLLRLGAACATVPRQAETPSGTKPAEESPTLPTPQVLDDHVTAGFADYCFKTTPRRPIGIKKITTTPADYLKQDPTAIAVINGMYFGPSYTPPNDQPEGIAFIADDNHLATENPRHSRGYFTISKNGLRVDVRDSFSGDFPEYFLVIGTHPTLVMDYKVHPQARESRYQRNTAARSAIGTKQKEYIDTICFAVQEQPVTIEEWAEQLEREGYRGALNLDGASYSQLAVRGEENVPQFPSFETASFEHRITTTKGSGTTQTRLVIFQYDRTLPAQKNRY